MTQPVSQQALHNAEILVNGQFSDFTITCQDHEFKVHRAILIGQSDRLDVLVDGPFRESTERCVSFLEDDKVGVAILLFYIYTGKYPQNPSNSDWPISLNNAFRAFMPSATDLLAKPLILHTDMIRVAEKFMIPGLAQQAADGLRHEVQHNLIQALGDGASFRLGLETLGGAIDWTGDLETALAFVAWFIVNRIPSRLFEVDFWVDVSQTVPKLGNMLTRECLCRQTPQTWKCGSCDGQFEEPNPNILVMTPATSDPSENDKFEWVECVCRFRGFCHEDRRCRYEEADHSMTTFHSELDGCLCCDDCVAALYEGWQYPCGVQKSEAAGFKKIEGLDQAIDCFRVNVAAQTIVRYDPLP